MKTMSNHASLKEFLSEWIVSVIAAIMLMIVSPVTAAAVEWPRVIDTPEAKIVVYQPQLESFKDDRMTTRAAVSVTKKGETEPVFGAVWMSSRVSTDRNTRMVRLLDLDVTDVRFPDIEKADTGKIERFERILEKEIPKGMQDISLDRVLAMLELVEKEKEAAGDLKNTPPKIIFVTHPAMLVTIEGEPELRKVENSDLMRVVNTPFFIVFEPSGKKYYLKGGDEWLSSGDVMGPWQTESRPPSSAVALAARAEEGQEQEKEGKKESDRMPQVIVSTVPTELIVAEGEPKYKSISGTGLLYMSNTKSDVFMEIDSQSYFVLLSGRWFSSRSLNDTKWSYIPSEKLPADFKKIPPGSDKGRVLAQVAGTEEAKEAVLDTHIPQTAAVQRSGTAVTAEYDGTPKFERIEDTEMYYAVNTPYSVIRIGTKYYLCHEAVWYVASEPLGPWVVAVSVPQVVYTMPPSSPVYHVRYVYIYDYTPEVVYIGYYPGYVGTYVYGGTVVYGTGWYYRPWYGHYYYARPVTWGVAVRYNPYTGGWGVRVGYGGPVGWVGYGSAGWVGVGRIGWYGGGWYGRGGYYGDAKISRSVTTPRGTWTSEIEIDRKWGEVDIDRDVSFQPNENLYDKRDKRREAQEGRRGEHADRREQRPGVSEDRKRDRAGRGTTAAQTGREKAGSRSFSDKDLSRYKNDVFADKKGNVYRKTDSGWQQRDKSGWSRPDTSSRKSSYQQNRSSLDRSYNARSRGSQRSSSYSQYRGSGSRSGSYSRGSRGGGRGGGRRR